jgi:hypothetical protein
MDTKRCTRTGNVDDHGMVFRRISGRFISRESTRGGFILMENKPNYYANIPANVRYDKDLTASAKLLYGEITALCNSEGYCWAGNPYFAELYGMSTRNISRLISQLNNKGYIKVVVINEFERKIYLSIAHDKNVVPHDKNDIGVGQKSRRGQDENVQPPHDKNVYKNNTSFNTTSNTTSNNKKINKKESKTVELNDHIENEFQAFWNMYPKKRGGKENTKKSFIKARKIKKIPYETIINGLNMYIDYINSSETEEEFIAHGSTWLNQERWEDEYLAVPKKKKLKNFMDLLDNDFRGEFTNGHERNAEIIDHDTSYLPYP